MLNKRILSAPRESSHSEGPTRWAHILWKVYIITSSMSGFTTPHAERARLDSNTVDPYLSGHNGMDRLPDNWNNWIYYVKRHKTHVHVPCCPSSIWRIEFSFHFSWGRQQLLSQSHTLQQALRGMFLLLGDQLSTTNLSSCDSTTHFLFKFAWHSHQKLTCKVKKQPRVTKAMVGNK